MYFALLRKNKSYDTMARKRIIVLFTPSHFYWKTCAAAVRFRYVLNVLQNNTYTALPKLIDDCYVRIVYNEQ